AGVRARAREMAVMTAGCSARHRNCRALVVVAKAPLIGEVKTRLCPPLTPSEACTLYGCLLEDIVTKMADYHEAELWIAFAPGGEDYFQRTFAEGRRLLSQRGRDLGEKVHHIFVDLFRLGYQQVVVADSDSPTVPLSSVARAYKLLGREGCDLVLGPSIDGGYYLVGLKSPTEGLFRQIPWSSAAVLQKTLGRASELGLRAELLPPAYDIDVEKDLRQLWEDLKALPELQERAPRTHAFLTRLFTD
ncbi:MAG: TIGR04282 family arsenosugar biosynthesis glycosyltransferase, partial [Candidatus Binatia bacterium]